MEESAFHLHHGSSGSKSEDLPWQRRQKLRDLDQEKDKGTTKAKHQTKEKGKAKQQTKEKVKTKEKEKAKASRVKEG